MSLFVELAERGHLKDVKRVVDLGSQELHFGPRDYTSAPYKASIRRALVAMGGPAIDDEQLDRLANRAPARDFYALLGIEYKALDADGWYGRPFDFNLDRVEPQDRGRFCLTTNCGTTEHLLHQQNAFTIAHDLTRVGGLMLHALPFFGYVDHGYFNYNPNFFFDLARFNAYDILGLWLAPTNTAALIPWSPGGAVLEHLKVSTDHRHNIGIFCAFRKTTDLDFCVPFQRNYEPAQAPENLDRYSYVVDGARLSGSLAVAISQRQGALDKVAGRSLVGELMRRARRRLLGSGGR
jgi:hypothetical protein